MASIENLWQLPETALVEAYEAARRRYAEKKFARDTQRARLEWLRAKAFAAATGSVAERRAVVDGAEDLARKGQEVRETTRDLDLIKVDVDVIVMVARMRGTHVTDSKGDEASEGADAEDGHEAR